MIGSIILQDERKDPPDGQAGEPRILVQEVRELTEAQFDFWLAALNRAVAAMGGGAEIFTRDDRQKTVSYWYMLMLLLEIYAADRNPFRVEADECWWSDGLVSTAALSARLADRYKKETVRRYISDLKRCRLIAHDGRGPEATVRLAAPTIRALVDTMGHWMTAFGALNHRYGQMGR